MSVRPERYAGVADADLSGKTVLVTGSSDGIGREAALALGRLGARVLVHGRSRSKVDRVVGEITDAGGRASAYTADFVDLEAVRGFARAVRDDVDRLDALANNAGTYFRVGRLTDAGVEATMAVNHLAPFLLTHLLAPVIPAGGRIVTTASAAHQGADLDLSTLDRVDDYDGFSAYARSKLANVLFTRELARRLDARTANCLHPGFVPGSALWRDSPLYVRAVVGVLSALPPALTRRVIDTPATGAANLVYLVAAADVAGVSGEYFADCEPRQPSATARDDDLARRLWTWSEERVELDSAARLE